MYVPKRVGKGCRREVMMRSKEVCIIECSKVDRLDAEAFQKIIGVDEALRMQSRLEKRWELGVAYHDSRRKNVQVYIFDKQFRIEGIRKVIAFITVTTMNRWPSKVRSY